MTTPAVARNRTSLPQSNIRAPQDQAQASRRLPDQRVPKSGLAIIETPAQPTVNQFWHGTGPLGGSLPKGAGASRHLTPERLAGVQSFQDLTRTASMLPRRWSPLAATSERAELAGILAATSAQPHRMPRESSVASPDWTDAIARNADLR
jgi:hypothetical protein